jgi:hypothetical protein
VEARVCSVVLVVDAMGVVAIGSDEAFDDGDVEVGVLLATIVRAVLVGRTASFCPRHTLYAEAALRSTVPQDVYTQPRAISPSDSPPRP